MIVSGAMLKTVLKRDNLFIGVQFGKSCAIVDKFCIEKCTKPGLLKLSPAALLTANTYGMHVSINPEIMENCEVSYSHFVEPHAEALPSIYVRPANKEFDLNAVAYLYKLFVIDGRVKK